jgi:transposase
LQIGGLSGRSTHAAAIDRESGELTRARFGAGVKEVRAWLQALPQPIQGCYQAGPIGYALYRAAERAGLRVDVVAPSKTPRAAADGVKTDRKDAELLVRVPAGRVAGSGRGAAGELRGGP